MWLTFHWALRTPSGSKSHPGSLNCFCYVLFCFVLWTGHFIIALSHSMQSTSQLLGQLWQASTPSWERGGNNGLLMHKIAQSNLELTCVDSFRLQSFICDSLLSSQFNKWLRDSKSRVLDIFRRMDHDRDGKLTREQFITGILNTSKRDIIFQPSVTYRFNQALSPCTLAWHVLWSCVTLCFSILRLPHWEMGDGNSRQQIWTWRAHWLQGVRELT